MQTGKYAFCGLTKPFAAVKEVPISVLSRQKTFPQFQITLTEDIWHWHSLLSIKVYRVGMRADQNETSARPTFCLVSEITGAAQTERKQSCEIHLHKHAYCFWSSAGPELSIHGPLQEHDIVIKMLYISMSWLQVHTCSEWIGWGK